MPFTARECSADETRELRRSVLRPNLDPGEPLPGEDADGVRQLGAFADDGSVLSAGLIFPQAWPGRPDSRAWRLRGMATDPDHRGSGGGTAVLGLAYDIARANGAELLWCHARETAIGFYERNGWLAVGPAFESVGVGHRVMWRPL